MRLTIKYCRPCGYLDRAEGLADRLRAETGAEVGLIPGNFGVFKVWADGRLLFDKRKTGGLIGWIGFGPIPADEEILGVIRRELGQGYPTANQ